MLLALTGATGFIGQYLLRDLPKRGYRLRVLLRQPSSIPMPCASAVIGDLARPRNMSAALEGVDAVIHSAGFTHGMSGIPEDDYRLLNTEATIGLARAARRAGAKRFVFLSSIRAQCGPTAETVLTEADDPNPTDAYGRSKLAAERGLTELDLDWVSAPGSSGLRAWRQRQRGATHAARALALSTAVGQLWCPALARCTGKSVGGDRDCAESARNSTAAVHCRRCRGVNGRGNDRGHARRAGAPPKSISDVPGVA